MKTTPAVESENESERENHSLSRVIFNRIGTLERTRLQTRCLQLLSATPVWNQLVFRGGVALHGVYLHGRCSRDLDFLAPAEVQERFVEILTEQGIALQKKEEARTPFFPMRGTVFKDIAVGIDVCSRESSQTTWEHALFQGVGGERVPVRVMPLVHSIAEKLNATSMRAQSPDFYDVWLFSQQHPSLLPELARLLNASAKWKFDAQNTWSHLQEVRDDWHQELIPLMPRVPPFETVEQDLARVMKQLCTASTFNP